MVQTPPRNLRLHIGLFGRRNVGKSSIVNALTGQEVAIVSPTPGTTTDPVERAMELLPLGPVVFIDTAGLDDAGALGERRVLRTKRVIDRTDLGLLVAEAAAWGEFEDDLLAELRARDVPVVVALNKSDLAAPSAAVLERLRAAGVAAVGTAAPSGLGIEELRRALLAAVPAGGREGRAIAGDLLGPGELAVLVVPIDSEAPKGRLILPQVQTIRDILDHGSFCLVVRERELVTALARLSPPPKMVVTDSQAFLRVAAETPPEVMLTSFSILLARFQGDLAELVRGARAIERLTDGDTVLVAESCTHHPTEDDIGRVKIPRWLRHATGRALEFATVRGGDFPDDLSPYALVVHCGHCMGSRREMLARIARCRLAGVPITNYGLAIASALGILDRALGPFPEVLAAAEREPAARRA